MAEQPRMGEQSEKPKIVVPHICMDTVKRSSREATSTPTSPLSSRKQSSVKYNCLCSPTTHAGSFRCRYHRNTSFGRNSMSVGAKLSELAGKINWQMYYFTAAFGCSFLTWDYSGVMLAPLCWFACSLFLFHWSWLVCVVGHGLGTWHHLC